MKITVTIDSCIDCRHLGHSGAFTPGGAKSVCSHDDAVECANTFKGFEEPPNSVEHINDPTSRLHKAAVAYYSWRRRVIRNIQKIPAWCPLKQGGAY